MRRCIILLAPLLLHCGFAEAYFASKAWEKSFPTNDSADRIHAVTLDELAGSAYIAGNIVGPRGVNVSLKGLVYGQDESIENGAVESDLEHYDNSKKFEDGIILSFGSNTGRVRWVHRLIEHYSNSKYFGVGFSKDETKVYAVGSALNPSNGMENALLTILDAQNGQLKSAILYPSSGTSYFTDIIVTKDALYMCGSDSSIENVEHPVGVEEGQTGGVFILRADTEGAVFWVVRDGLNTKNDRCGGISYSQTRKELYLAATVFPGGSDEKTGFVLASAFDEETGQKRWTTTVTHGNNSADTATGILTFRNSIFIAADRMNGFGINHMYLFKFTASSGLQLWGQETCCSGLTQLVRDRGYRGQGVAVSAGGLIMGTDEYIYQLGYFKNTNENSEKRYATVVTRTSLFGRSVPSRDRAIVNEYYQYGLHAPRDIAGDITGGRIYAIATYGDPEGSDEEANSAKIAIYGIDLKMGDGADAHFLPSSGPYCSIVDVMLHRAYYDVEQGFVLEMMAEQLRLEGQQVSLRNASHGEFANQTALASDNSSLSRVINSNSTTDNSTAPSDTNLVARITLFSDHANDTSINKTVQRLNRILTVVEQDGLTSFERLVGVRLTAEDERYSALIINKGSSPVLTDGNISQRGGQDNVSELSAKPSFWENYSGLVAFGAIFVVAACITGLAALLITRQNRDVQKLDSGDSEYWSLNDNPWSESDENKSGKRSSPV